jgi:hypothetical protein
MTTQNSPARAAALALVKANPIPIAMAGVGLTWLLVSVLVGSLHRVPNTGDGIDVPDDTPRLDHAVGTAIGFGTSLSCHNDVLASLERALRGNVVAPGKEKGT